MNVSTGRPIDREAPPETAAASSLTALADEPNGPRKVVVLGAGSWGTTFAKVLADAAREASAERTVHLWGRNPESMERIRETGRNERYVPRSEPACAWPWIASAVGAESIASARWYEPRNG